MSMGANGDAAAIYKKFNHTRSQMVVVCGRQDAASTPQPSIQLVESVGPPVTDLRANILNSIRILNYTGGTDYMRLQYTDTGGTNYNWRDSDKSWQTGGSIISTPQATPRDNYRSWGFEWDADNQRVRLFGIHQSFGSSENIACGPRLYSITDWVSLSSVRNGTSANLWLVIGWPETNFYSSASSAYIEWIKETWGPRVYVQCNGKNTSSNYAITGYTGYDLRTGPLLPDGINTVCVPEGTSGQWDDSKTQWGSVIRTRSGLYVASYSGTKVSNGALQIGVASATDPLGTWTKHANNPVIPLGPPGSTYEGYMRFNVLVEDLQELDPNKRFKLIVNGTDASTTTRTLLFDAPDWFGPYTYDGVLLEEDVDETGIAFRGQPVWHRGQWHMFYNCSVGGLNVIRRAVSKYLKAGTFVKEGVTLNTQSVGAYESTVTSVSGRYITVPDTTDAVRDMILVGTNSVSVDTYVYGRIRKVVSGTLLEMYEDMPGLTTSSILRSANYGSDNSLNGVSYIDGVWYFSMTMFKVFTSHPTFGAHHEGNGVYVGGANPNDPIAVDWLATPLIPFGTEAARTSISNENTRLLTERSPFASLAPVIRRNRSTLIRR